MSHPVILPYRGVFPRIHPSAFIAPGAVIVGDVEIGAESSVWFGCVVRADMNKIRIGARTNVQDGAVIHVSLDKQAALAQGDVPAEGFPTLIGDDVTVGHMALLHACTVESGAFVGMASVVMDGATIEANAVLAAGSVLPPGKAARAGEIWMGRPAAFSRSVSEAESAEFRSRAGQYVRLAQEYRKGGAS
ncbi:MAG: gamma carbonic anhydrase family protein [Alphaproteobacteria bacterium]|nr:gamma carbonic anhydrase family protein [Alphaproteobacteria bacterium]